MPPLLPLSSCFSGEELKYRENLSKPTGYRRSYGVTGALGLELFVLSRLAPLLATLDRSAQGSVWRWASNVGQQHQSKGLNHSPTQSIFIENV